MMHVEPSSILTTTFSRTKAAFVFMDSSSSTSTVALPPQQQQQQQQQQSQLSSSLPQHQQQQQSASSSSSSFPPNQQQQDEGVGEWREIDSKQSSDTATVFPLLQSQLSLSTSWAENSNNINNVESRIEDDKRIDASFPRDAVINNSNNADEENVVAIQAKSDSKISRERVQQSTALQEEEMRQYQRDKEEEIDNHHHNSNGVGDDDDDGVDDEDSSAAMSLYLESKLAKLWADDDAPPYAPQSPPASIQIIHSESDTRESITKSCEQEPLQHQKSTVSSLEKENDEGVPQRPAVPLPSPFSLSTYSRRQSAPSVVENRHMEVLSVSEHSPMDPTPPPPYLGALPPSLIIEQERTSSPYRDRHSLQNPVTGYSPGRTVRKRIWGPSNAHLPPARRTPPRYSPSLDASEEDEASSITSDEVLERISTQIRAELRYAELVQLAEEAERAADSGIESFTGRPWFNTGAAADAAAAAGEEDTLSPRMMVRPSPIKRHASYSEGLPMPLSPMRKHATPLGIRNLRDVEDVFPSFESFHKNLRTHFLRARVSQNILVFEEEERNNKDAEKGSKSLKDHHRHTSSRTRDFMDSFNGSFNFDILGRGRVNSIEEADQALDRNTDFGVIGFWNDDNDSTDDESDVGEVLAEHIHSVERPIRRPAHPMTLPGLPRLEATNPIYSGNLHKTVSHRTFGRAPSVDDEGIARPRVLFHHDTPAGLDLPTLNADEGGELTGTPVDPGKNHDFVTPARLREIRRPKARDLNDFMNEHNNMILPANSVIQESPYRNTPNNDSSLERQRPGVSRHPNIPVNHLLLPAFSSTEDEEAEPILQLAPSNDSLEDDDDDDDMAPNPLSPLDKELAKHMDNRPKSPTLMTPPGQASKESPKSNSPVGSLVLPASEDEATVKEVTVSILDRSIDSNSNKGRSTARRIVRPSVALAEKRWPHEQSVFTMRQLVQTMPQTPFDSIDCRCLSPHELLLDEDDETGGEHAEKNAKTKRKSRGASALRGAMNIFKKMSPGRNKHISAERDLFVHPRANDDFLQNYLYCTKDPQKEDGRRREPPNRCMTTDSCQDDGMCCGVGFSLARGYCDFVAQDLDCAVRNTQEVLPLSLNTHNIRREADSWFDAATERVDGMLEGFIRGSTPNKDDRFQPPSLRKIMRSGVRSSQTPSTGKIKDESTNTLAADGCGGDGDAEGRPAVQALFQPTEGDLSDTQFALVYGTSRSDYRTESAVATSSPLRTSNVEHNVPRMMDIRTSYSSDSSDQEEQRLSMTMTYISEPSMSSMHDQSNDCNRA